MDISRNQYIEIPGSVQSPRLLHTRQRQREIGHNLKRLMSLRVSSAFSAARSAADFERQTFHRVVAKPTVDTDNADPPAMSPRRLSVAN